MNPIIATVDTQISSYSSIGTINVLDDVTIDLTILTNGIVNAPWIEPEFQLIGVKADKNEVRQLDGFNVTSLENRTLAIKLKNEMLTYPGMLKLQLITKDSGRTSTTVFYLYVGQSLEHDIVSHRDVKVLDDLEAYVEKANHNLEVYEQRMDIRDEQFNNLNDLMNQAEAKRDQAELNRQQIFDVNEASRTRTFNNQMNNQETSFNDVQIERANEFGRDQTKRADDFVQAQNNREQAFNESQSVNQSTFNSNEKKRQDEFNANQAANQKIFNDSESARARTFEVAESERCENEKTRKEDESKRVSDEVKRVEAENKRQQKMQEFEDIANQIASDLQEQVARVDEFVTANELKLLEEDARIDYMGNQQKSIRKVNEANVDYAVKSAIGEFNYLDYEGQHITATNSIEGHARSAILKGQTLVNMVTLDTTKEYILEQDGLSIKKVRFNLIDGFENDVYTIILEMSNVNIINPNGTWVVYINTPSEIDNGADNTTIKSFIKNGRVSFIYKPSRGLKTKNEFYISLHTDSGVGSTITIKNVVVLKGDHTQEDIPYFEGMQSVRMPVLKTVGKNLSPINEYETTVWEYAKGYQGFNRILAKNILIDENKEYRLSFTKECKDGLPTDLGDILVSFSSIPVSSNVNDHNGVYAHCRENKGKKYAHITMANIGQGTTYVGKRVKLTNIQLEVGAITTYEPYKSNILSTPSDLELRGVGEVKDKLNLLTGELTQHIEEVVLDGSEDENWILATMATSVTGYTRFYLNNTDNMKSSTPNMVSDKLPYMLNPQTKSTECIGHMYNSKINIVVSNSRLDEIEVGGFRQWLSQNPITIQYELAEPTIKTVDLSDNVVYSYDGTTHYSCSSEEGSLVPTLSVKVPTDVQATIAQQRNTIVALEAENEALKDGLIEANQYREDGDMDLLSNQWDIDFRLFEIEMALDVPMAVAYKIAKENDIMSRYLQAKTLILGGRYERSKMEYQLKRYLEAGQLTQEEYDELISLMDAREMLE